jgi:general secretion pathway protein G
MKNLNKRLPALYKNGFTLIEISVALAIMSVLMLGAIPVYRAEQVRTKEKELRASLIQIRQALDDYKRAAEEGKIAKPAGSSGYPENLVVLARGVSKLGSPKPEWIYFLRNLPRDPFAAEELLALPAALSWDTRAYSSPPDAPVAGTDVFDVFSKSKKIGMNGVPYNKW